MIIVTDLLKTTLIQHLKVKFKMNLKLNVKMKKLSVHVKVIQTLPVPLRICQQIWLT